MISERSDGHTLNPKEVLRAERHHLSPGLALAHRFAGQGAVEVKSEGATVFLDNGRTLLDFGSYAVTLLGHCHDEVVQAVEDQLRRMPTSTRTLANPTSVTFAAELVEAFAPQALSRVWLGTTGADVIEAALKLARLATGRSAVLGVVGAFHGKTAGALALTWSPRYRGGLEDSLGPADHLDPCDPEAVAKATACRDYAALVFEPIRGEGGVRPLHPRIAKRWIDDAHNAGAYVIADEIQTGLHRCGPLSLALDQCLDIDGLVLGKALGGGVMPLSALLATDELYRPLVDDPFIHTSTFGGHPLATAAGRATLREMPAVSKSVFQGGSELDVRLDALCRKHPDTIVEVRGAGFLRGIEFRDIGVAGEVLVDLYARGLAVSPCLSDPATLRLLPPATVTAEELHRGLTILESAVDAIN